MRNNTREWIGEVEYLRSLTKEILGHELPIAITEVNSDPSSAMLQETSPDSFYNAIWYADVLGQLMNADVFMVNQWVLSQRSTGLGLLKGTEIRPTFYVFPLYKNFGSEQVYAASGVEDVDIFASKREDGKLTLMVINLSDVEQRIPLQLKGVKAQRSRSLAFGCCAQCRESGHAGFSTRWYCDPAGSIGDTFSNQMSTL